MSARPTDKTTALYHKIAARAKEAEDPYLPLAPHPPPSPVLEEGRRVPLVGRRQERASLVDRVEQALDGRGGLILVKGEPGVGKTRLLQEVGKDAAWREVEVLWGQGREPVELSPYGVLSKALGAALSALRARQLARRVDEVWLREVSLILPQLAEWLPDLSPRAALEPAQERKRLLEALGQVLLASGQIAPHLLILDDLQWADEGTLEALIHLVPRLSESRVLVIGSYRGEEARARPVVWDALRALDQAGGHERLSLAPLSSEEVGDLIREGLGLDNAAPRFEQRLFRETQGNPLFVLETLRALHDEGLLFRDEAGAWSTPWDDTTTDYAELPLPAGVRDVIAGRLNRLDPAVREVLNTAAVLGDDFDLSLLSQATTPGPTVLEAVDELLRRGLFVEDGEIYRFTHDKIRQVAYDELGEGEQRQLHRRVGEVLETADGTQPQALARHFTRGHVWDKAVRYHHEAGNHGAAVHAYSAALRHYDQALALADAANLSAGRHFELLAAREAVLDVLGRREAQAADLEIMAQLARDNPQRLFEVHRRRARLFAHTGRLREAELNARDALALAEGSRDEVSKAAARVILGEVFNQWSKPARAVTHLQAAVEIYQQRGHRQQEAEARQALGTTVLGLQEYAAARAELETALALCEELGDRLGQAKAWGRLGVLHRQEGDADAAEVAYRKALESCRAIGYRGGEARNLLNLGLLFNAQGEVDRALRFFEQAVVVCREIGERRGEAIVRANSASVRYAILGDDETAAREAETALAYCQEIGDLSYEALSLIVLGGIAQRRGQLDVARTHLEMALSKLQTSGHRWLIAQAQRDLALLARDEARPEVALEHLNAAEAMCRELGLAGLGVEVQALRGVMLLALGQPEKALAASSEAVAHLRPGVNRAHLVHFWHYEVLRALDRTDEARSAIEQAYSELMRMLDGVSAEKRRLSLEQVPEHRAIVAAWEATHPRRITFCLPHADAPTGRPLRDDEWVEVTWTVSHPDDKAVQGKVARRRRRLRRLLREAAEQEAAPRVDDLAEALEVSVSTIKRDLAALRQTGHAVHTRGSRSG